MTNSCRGRVKGTIAQIADDLFICTLADQSQTARRKSNPDNITTTTTVCTDPQRAIQPYEVEPASRHVTLSYMKEKQDEIRNIGQANLDSLDKETKKTATSDNNL